MVLYGYRVYILVMPYVLTKLEIKEAIEESIGDVATEADIESAIENTIGEVVTQQDIETAINNSVQDPVSQSDIETAISNQVGDVITQTEVEDAIDTTIGETGQITSSSTAVGEENAAELNLGKARTEVMLKFDIAVHGTIYFDTSETGSDWFEHDLFEVSSDGEDNVVQYIVESDYARAYADSTELTDSDINTLKLVSKT